MIETILYAFWGLWLFGLLVAVIRVGTFPIAMHFQQKRWGKPVKKQEPVALILPAKGFALPHTTRVLNKLFAQDYPHYRVIVAFESWDDPIAQYLCEQLDLSQNRPTWRHPEMGANLREVALVCSGESEDEGQKVHNQRAAIAELTTEDRIIVFADADIEIDSTWLGKLVAPLNHGTHAFSTSYRWLVPRRPSFASQLASTINASITTQGGPEWSSFLWGGTMAMTRDAFDKIDVPGLLRGSLNDDLRISKVARKAGNRIAFVRSLITPTKVDFTLSSFLEFARRQYTQVRFFSPILYTCANIILAGYVIGLLSIVAAIVAGVFWAWVPLAAAYLLDQVRACLRQRVYLKLFQSEHIRKRLLAASWLEHMLTPLWLVIHWLIIASTWKKQTIDWAGIRYRIVSNSETEVLHRNEETPSLPVGVPSLALSSFVISPTQPISPVVATTGSGLKSESATFTTPVESDSELVPSSPDVPVEPTEPIESNLEKISEAEGDPIIVTETLHQIDDAVPSDDAGPISETAIAAGVAATAALATNAEPASQDDSAEPDTLTEETPETALQDFPKSEDSKDPSDFESSPEWQAVAAQITARRRRAKSILRGRRASFGHTLVSQRLSKTRLQTRTFYPPSNSPDLPSGSIASPQMASVSPERQAVESRPFAGSMSGTDQTPNEAATSEQVKSNGSSTGTSLPGDLTSSDDFQETGRPLSDGASPIDLPQGETAVRFFPLRRVGAARRPVNTRRQTLTVTKRPRRSSRPTAGSKALQRPKTRPCSRRPSGR
ncbi:MAG: glycosyltransferase [Verrucomicrobiota bacterium]